MLDDPTWNASVQVAAASFHAALNLSYAGKYLPDSLNNPNLSDINQSANQTPFNRESSFQHAPVYNEATSLRVAVLLAMGAASLIGNVATMWNIKKSCISRRVTRHSWSAVYFFIFHLAVADLLVTVFCIFGEAAWSFTVEWKAGVVACKALKFMQMFSLYLSTFVLVLIGVDRWIAVKYPWKSLHMMRRCYRLIGVAYALAVVLSVPQLVIFDVARGPFTEEFHQCVTYNFYTAYWQEQAYTTFTLLFMFVLPLIILITTYVATFRTIAASERMFPPARTPTTPINGIKSSRSPPMETTEFNGMDRGQSSIRQQLINRAKVKSLRISVAIVLAFIVCWSPYYVMMLTFMFLNPDQKYSENLQSAIFFFGMSNSVANPLIYGAFNLWPMRKKVRNSRCSFTKDASTQRTGLSTMGTTIRHQESRSLVMNGRNPSDGSIISAKKLEKISI